MAEISSDVTFESDIGDGKHWRVFGRDRSGRELLNQG